MQALRSCGLGRAPVIALRKRTLPMAAAQDVVDDVAVLTKDVADVDRLERSLKPRFEKAGKALRVVSRSAFLSQAHKGSFDLKTFFANLKTRVLGQNFVYCPRVSSTQTILNEYATVRLPYSRFSELTALPLFAWSRIQLIQRHS